MKTCQILTRKMGDFDVLQRTSDGYFDGNALLVQWNKVKNNPRRRLDEFKDSAKTLEFISALEEELEANGEISPMDVFQPIKEIKGRMTKNGKTPDQAWMHPYLFIKFSMWINPRFEVKVIKFVYDELIKYRNEAGDAYKEMASAISSIVEKSFMPTAMQEIAKAINYIVYNNHVTEIRNKKADESKIRELYEIEKDIAKLIHFGFINNFEQLKSYLRKRWVEKWQPKELTA